MTIDIQESVDPATDMDGTRKILHVDDDRDLVELTAEYLEREGDSLDVRTATTVGDALEILDREPVECIVSDYEMSPTDGMAFFETVRERDEDLPFILLTGKGSEELASEAISRGVTDYFQKGHGIDHYKKLANRISNAAEKYRSERRLEAKNDHFSLFFEQSPLGVIEWDESFEITRVNGAAESILGYSEAELAGRSWEWIVPEDEREAVEEVTAELIEAEGGYSSVNENVREDGERIVCEWHNRIVTDDDGEVVTVFSQFQDITERKEREEAITNLHEVATDLATCESRAEVYETAVEAANGMPAFDQAGIVLQDGGSVRVERASDETLARDVTRTLGEDISDPDEGTVVFEEIHAGNPANVGSLIHIPIGGPRVFQVYSCEPEAFDDRDVEMAELLARHTENELDRLAYERALEEKNEQLDEFVSVVSHDLRNPIQVITATIELAEETGDPEYFERCSNAAQRMEQLLDDLLTLARDRDRSIETAPVDLAARVDDCWQNVETGDATVVNEVTGVVDADESRLNQLLENLFDNAVEHAGPDATVTVGELADSQGFYIADDGPGIPPEERDQVFDHGYSGTQDGTGFGLAIVSRVAEDHGWDISVTEGETGGARFEIETE
jgi:PAS domain S-box-containing protein